MSATYNQVAKNDTPRNTSALPFCTQYSDICRSLLPTKPLSYTLMLQWHILFRVFFDLLFSIIYGPGGNGKNRVINTLMTIIDKDGGGKIIFNADPEEVHQNAKQITRDVNFRTIRYHGIASVHSMVVTFLYRNIPRVNNIALWTIPDYHKAYDSPQYPLFFCKGKERLLYERKESLWKHRNYKLIKKIDSKLWQYMVDKFCILELERLRYIENNQKQLRADKFEYLGVIIRETMAAEQQGRGNIHYHVGLYKLG